MALEANTREREGYCDHRNNHGFRNVSTNRDTRDQQIKTVPPSVLHIRHRRQQREKLGTMGAERAETEHAQENMGMTGTTKTTVMEGMETSEYGVVYKGW
jgi:hypothetical protein